MNPRTHFSPGTNKKRVFNWQCKESFIVFKGNFNKNRIEFFLSKWNTTWVCS
jgi:hypothetical protein